MRFRRLCYFFDREDEASLSESLKARCPEICFLDGCIWPTAEPLSRPSMADCESRVVYLWDPSVLARLPMIQMHGGFQGPSTGLVVQFMRSRLDGDQIEMGQLSISYDAGSPNQWPFFDRVWRVVKAAHCTTLICRRASDDATLRRGVKNLVTGFHACQRAREGLRLVSAQGADHYFVPQ